jgi:peptidoglycan/xylan/chitin deacetylase (PgdA/CDA1 family)
VTSVARSADRLPTRAGRPLRSERDWKPYTGPVPILVYHALGNTPVGAPFPGLYVSRPAFRAEMAWLHRQGYTGVTLDQVERAWYNHGRLPAKPIVISFDNGYPAQATFAPQVLSQYGWVGVLFDITLHHIRPSLVRNVIAHGWEVDSHSATHPDLTTLSGPALSFQVAGSRRFCYPSSRYNAATIAAVRAAGYVGAVTENAGYATRDQPYTLDRFEIEGGQGVAGLAADLAER